MPHAAETINAQGVTLDIIAVQICRGEWSCRLKTTVEYDFFE